MNITEWQGLLFCSLVQAQPQDAVWLIVSSLCILIEKINHLSYNQTLSNALSFLMLARKLDLNIQKNI